jgi:hypothetical protein
MRPSIRKVFDGDFHGLQIYWGDAKEVEFIGPAVLRGLSFNTAATCKLGHKIISYVYPVSASRTQENLTLEYKASPSSWPASWEAVPGTLTIQFDDEVSLEPIKVTWWNQDTGESCSLEPGKEWVYVEPPPPPDLKSSIRGRLLTSRLERPKQQALRNKLIASFSGCQITGATCLSTLEACHIVPVRNGGDDTLANALLLRRDIHALFDAGLLRLRQKADCWHIELAPQVSDSCYQFLHAVSLPLETFRLNTEHLLARTKLESRARSADWEGEK